MDIESVGIDPVRLRFVLMNIVKIFSLVFIGIATSAPPRSFAAEQASDVPAWLRAHVGEGEVELVAHLIVDNAADADAAGSANASSRAATFTPSPKMSPPSTITLPSAKTALAKYSG